MRNIIIGPLLENRLTNLEIARLFRLSNSLLAMRRIVRMKTVRVNSMNGEKIKFVTILSQSENLGFKSDIEKLTILE